MVTLKVMCLSNQYKLENESFGWEPKQVISAGLRPRNSAAPKSSRSEMQPFEMQTQLLNAFSTSIPKADILENASFAMPLKVVTFRMSGILEAQKPTEDSSITGLFGVCLKDKPSKHERLFDGEMLANPNVALVPAEVPPLG